MTVKDESGAETEVVKVGCERVAVVGSEVGLWAM